MERKDRHDQQVAELYMTKKMVDIRRRNGMQAMRTQVKKDGDNTQRRRAYG